MQLPKIAQTPVQKTAFSSTTPVDASCCMKADFQPHFGGGEDTVEIRFGSRKKSRGGSGKTGRRYENTGPAEYYPMSKSDKKKPEGSTKKIGDRVYKLRKTQGGGKKNKGPGWYPTGWA